MRGSRLAAAVATLSIGGVASVAMTGCGLIGELTGAGRPDVDFTTVQLHPTGDAGLWLDPGYSAGIGETWSVPGSACGAAEGVVAVSADNAIIGYDTATGAELWRVADISCTVLEAAAGDLYLARLTADGTEYVQVDIATGAEQVFYSAPIVVMSTSTIARGEDAVFIHASADVGPAVLAFAFDGTLRWQVPIETTNNCELLGTHLACASLESFTVLDAATGAAMIPETPIPADKDILWTTGGYTIVSSGISMDPETTTIYDFTGADIGTVEDADLPMNPAYTLGVAYTVEDLMSEGARWIEMVDADGRSLVHWDGALRLSATDAKLPDDVSLIAGGADGSTVLYSDYLAGTVTLAAADGTVLHTVEDGAADMAQILDGVIVASVYDGAMVTTVYLPAAGDDA